MSGADHDYRVSAGTWRLGSVAAAVLFWTMLIAFVVQAVRP